MTDITPYIRRALDLTYSAVGSLGLHPFDLYHINIKYDGSRVGLGNKIITKTELHYGVDGYCYGAQRLSFKHVSSKDIFISNGLLKDKDYKLTLVSPYTINGMSSGVDSSIFDINHADGYWQENYLLAIGSSMSPNGTIFKKIWSREDCNISDELYFRATGERLDFLDNL